MSRISLSLALLSSAYIALAPLPAAAQADAGARQTAQTLYDALLTIMKDASKLGFQGRFNRIGPIIDRTFDVPLVTRLVVGPGWNKISPADQKAVTIAFRRMFVSQIAGSFSGFNGERFAVDPKVEARGTDRLVKTELISPKRKPISLAYRLRWINGQWRIIDVFYQNQISQVATKRSDYSRIFAQGGASALIAHLNSLAERAANK